MKKIFSVLAGSALLLGACTLPQQANTTAQISTICKAAAPVVSAATATAPDPTSAAGVLLTFAQSACTADGLIASTLAPNLTDGTPGWLTDVVNGLALAAKVAPMVLAAI